MSYQKSLANMIEKSGLTLREIAEKCKELGVKVDPSYISKLQTGKQMPASDEITQVIAKACGGDPEELLFEGYMDKAPAAIKDFISHMSEYLRGIVIVFLKSQFSEEQIKVFEERFNQMSDRQFIQEITSNKESLPDFKDNTFIFTDYEDNQAKVVVNPLFGVKMLDNSMEPIIPCNAVLQMVVPENLDNGDIVIAQLEDDESFIIRRYIPLDDKVILIAENSTFKPITANKDALKIIGKIASYTKEL